MNTTTAIEMFRNVQHIFHMASVLQLTAHWNPQSMPVSDGATYDYIIVGGGTAGCVIASRLIEIKHVRVLLIEAGGDPPLESTYPGYFASMIGTDVDWKFTSTKESALQNHRHDVVQIPQGKMLGGSSSIGYMAYVRGNENDYDRWAAHTNDSSWSYKCVLRYFIKAEKLIDEKVLHSPKDAALHGTKGKLKLRKFYFEGSEDYYHALRELGYKHVVDINSRNPVGFTDMMYIAGKKVRQSTAYSFLRPVKDSPRLHVLKHALVTKLIFEGQNAVGVKVLTKNDKIITVKAMKEIIITAGVFKTPQLLMLSGIGPKQHLESKGIECLQDLPVGKNLLDHPIVPSVFKMGEHTHTKLPVNPDIISFPVIDGYFTFNKTKKSPDYMIRHVIITNPVKFLQLCVIVFDFSFEICDALYKGTKGKDISVAFSHLTYPKSNGEVLLRSKDMKDKPVINIGLDNNEDDLLMHAKQVMDFNRILNTTHYRKVDAEFVDPKLKQCSKLKMDSLKYWTCYVQGMASTIHYDVGTCAMGSVVDSKLFVKGFKRLRVCDASIMPTIISAPSLATVIMIAEKASDMIKKDFYKYSKRNGV